MSSAPPPPQDDGGGEEPPLPPQEPEGSHHESSDDAPGKRKRKRTSSTLQDCKWQEMYLRLVAYRQRTGNCLVPNRYPEDPSLGAWVATQRRNHRRMETMDSSAAAGLTPQRIQQLEEIGFEWVTTDPRHVPWDARYQELKAFYDKYGHSEVPMRWEENVQLSNWVSKQRQDYKLRQLGKTSRLTDERMALLKAVGFAWNIPRKGRKIKCKEIPVVPTHQRKGNRDDDYEDQERSNIDQGQQQPARAIARGATASRNNGRVATTESNSGGNSGYSSMEPMPPLAGTAGGASSSMGSTGNVAASDPPGSAAFASAVNRMATNVFAANGANVSASVSSGGQNVPGSSNPPGSGGNVVQALDLRSLLGLTNATVNPQQQVQLLALPGNASGGVASGNGGWPMPVVAQGSSPAAVLLPIPLESLMAALQQQPQQQQPIIPVVIPAASLPQAYQGAPGLLSMATASTDPPAPHPLAPVLQPQQGQQNINPQQQLAVQQILQYFPGLQQPLQQQPAQPAQPPVQQQPAHPPVQQQQRPQPQQPGNTQQQQQQQDLQSVLIQFLSQFSNNTNTNAPVGSG